MGTYDEAVAACPTPEYHLTHRYCPSCPWTEQGRPFGHLRWLHCPIDWQGPSDETCSDDLLVIPCVLRERHQGPHCGWHRDDDNYVFWPTGTSDLENLDGSVKQPQFAPEGGSEGGERD